MPYEEFHRNYHKRLPSHDDILRVQTMFDGVYDHLVVRSEMSSQEDLSQEIVDTDQDCGDFEGSSFIEFSNISSR